MFVLNLLGTQLFNMCPRAFYCTPAPPKTRWTGPGEIFHHSETAPRVVAPHYTGQVMSHRPEIPQGKK